MQVVERCVDVPCVWLLRVVDQDVLACSCGEEHRVACRRAVLQPEHVLCCYLLVEPGILSCPSRTKVSQMREPSKQMNELRVPPVSCPRP